jgi:hypothetical protein
MGCGVSKKKIEATILASKEDKEARVATEEVVIRLEGELEARQHEVLRLQVSEGCTKAADLCVLRMVVCPPPSLS